MAISDFLRQFLINVKSFADDASLTPEQRVQRNATQAALAQRQKEFATNSSQWEQQQQQQNDLSRARIMSDIIERGGQLQGSSQPSMPSLNGGGPSMGGGGGQGSAPAQPSGPEPQDLSSIAPWLHMFGMQGAPSQAPNSANATPSAAPTPSSRMQPTGGGGVASPDAGFGPWQNLPGGIPSFRMPLPKPEKNGIPVTIDEKGAPHIPAGQYNDVPDNVLATVFKQLGDSVNTKEKTKIPDGIAAKLGLPSGATVPDGEKLTDYLKLYQTATEAKESGNETLATLALKAAQGDPVARKAVALMKPGPQIVNYGNAEDPNSTLSHFINTTFSGKKYVDGSKLPPKELDNLNRQASAQGLTVLGKNEAEAMREIDTARQNQQDMFDQMGQFLPKDPKGRVLGGALKNKLSQYMQTNAILAAAGTYRTAAIQALRAAAGAKGLRINQAEIAQAVENDIPKATDTVETAMQRAANINKMLDSQENSMLKTDRSGLNRSNKIRVKLKGSGRTGKIDPSEFDSTTMEKL